MKNVTSAVALVLLLSCGAVAAQEAAKPADAMQPMDHSKMEMQDGKMDHSKMDMSGNKPMDHKKMTESEFTTLDKNKDGTVSKAEVPADHPLAAHFDMLDTDKSGGLSKAEFAKHHGM